MSYVLILGSFFYLPPSHLLGVGGALVKDLDKAGLVRQSPPGPLPQPVKEEGHMVTTGQPFLCPAELLPTTTQL